MTCWRGGSIWFIRFVSSQSWCCKQGHSQAASRLCCRCLTFKGAAAILHCADALRELLQSKFPFLCARRTIYNSAIELFMCLHRLSLDATGHVWEGGNVFMALFLISQATFFPSPSSPPPNRTPTLHAVQSRHAVCLSLKILSTRCFLRQCCVRHPWMSRRSSRWGRALVLLLTRRHSKRPPSKNHNNNNKNMFSVCKDQKFKMDYRLPGGKIRKRRVHVLVWESVVSVCDVWQPPR